jgi:hypothetical protein
MIVTFLNDKIKEDKTILLEPHSPPLKQTAVML